MAETLEVKIARMEEQMKNLIAQQTKLTEEVAELVGAMNRGKGAFGFAMVLAGVLGGGVVKLVSALLDKAS